MKQIKRATSIFLIAVLTLLMVFPAQAETPSALMPTLPVIDDSALIAEATPSLQAATPAVAVGAAAGIVMNAKTGEILFGKDVETAYFPASITKVMTALLVAENCKPGDTVVFSQKATTNLESGAVTIGLKEGDRLTVEDCLYALLLKSANEVANGLAEHVSGSVEAFAELMNKRAKELGCTNTHFVNPNGLNNPDHYTTAHDMARIAAAAFSNETLCKIDAADRHTIGGTRAYPSGLTLYRSNKILTPTSPYYYPYAIAGKTGYTSKAGNTLVTVAEKDGVRLVAVILKNTKYMGHYTDTRALMDYGFSVSPVQPVIPAPTSPASAESAGTAAETMPAAVELIGPGGQS